MGTNFPTSLDSYTNPDDVPLGTAGTSLHTTQHANHNDAVEALEAKVGINSTTNPATLDYKANFARISPDLRTFLAGMLAGSNAIDAASGASAVFVGDSFLIGFD